MTPELPEKLLGIDIDPPTEQRERERSEPEEPEERVRFVLFGIGEHRLAIHVDEVASITDVPAEFTRVPRGPNAVDGLTDLRGEITAVIDPGLFFPSDNDRPGREQLLVLNVPDDQQPAAVQVDDVLTVDAVPEKNILEAGDLEGEPISGDALDHPLVGALIQRRQRTRVGSGRRPSSSQLGGDSDDQSIDADGRSTGSSRAHEEVIEIIPLIDVETLLAASRYRRSDAHHP